jgi:hypothetical protein
MVGKKVSDISLCTLLTCVEKDEVIHRIKEERNILHARKAK